MDDVGEAAWDPFWAETICLGVGVSDGPFGGEAQLLAGAEVDAGVDPLPGTTDFDAVRAFGYGLLSGCGHDCYGCGDQDRENCYARHCCARHHCVRQRRSRFRRFYRRHEICGSTAPINSARRSLGKEMLLYEKFNGHHSLTVF